MPSTNKTSNYQLNQWVGSDLPQRNDFNTDNSKIDAAIKALSNTVTTFSKATTSEINSGVDNNHFVNPLGLRNYFQAQKATAQEVTNGSNVYHYINPSALKTQIQNAVAIINRNMDNVNYNIFRLYINNHANQFSYAKAMLFDYMKSQTANSSPVDTNATTATYTSGYYTSDTNAFLRQFGEQDFSTYTGSWTNTMVSYFGGSTSSYKNANKVSSFITPQENIYFNKISFDCYASVTDTTTLPTAGFAIYDVTNGGKTKVFEDNTITPPSTNADSLKVVTLLSSNPLTLQKAHRYEISFRMVSATKLSDKIYMGTSQCGSPKDDTPKNLWQYKDDVLADQLAGILGVRFGLSDNVTYQTRLLDIHSESNQVALITNRTERHRQHAVSTENDKLYSTSSFYTYNYVSSYFSPVLTKKYDGLTLKIYKRSSSNLTATNGYIYPADETGRPLDNSSPITSFQIDYSTVPTSSASDNSAYIEIPFNTSVTLTTGNHYALLLEKNTAETSSQYIYYSTKESTNKTIWSSTNITSWTSQIAGKTLSMRLLTNETAMILVPYIQFGENGQWQQMTKDTGYSGTSFYDAANKPAIEERWLCDSNVTSNLAKVRIVMKLYDNLTLNYIYPYVAIFRKV